MILVEIIEPQNAPKRPTSAADTWPYPIMVIITTKPIPNAVPKLVSEMSWYFLNYDAKVLSFDRAMIAGLSERKVMTAPRAATPGRL